MSGSERTNGLYNGIRRAIENPQIGDLPLGASQPIELAVDSVWQLPGGIPASPDSDLFKKRLSPVQMAILDLSSKGYEPGEINREIGMNPVDIRREREAMIRTVLAKSMTHAAYLACVADAYDKPLDDLPELKRELTPVQLRILWFEVNGRSRDEINTHFRLSRGAYEQNIAGIQSAVNGRTLPHAGRIAFDKKIIPSLNNL